MDNETTRAFEHLLDAKERLENDKPTERTELARNYAIAITDLEKIIAYVHYYLMDIGEI